MMTSVPPLARFQKALDRQQAGFYKRWVNAWRRGEVLDVNGEYQYVWNYLTSLKLEPPYEDVLSELLALYAVYASVPDESLRFYMRMWAADCHILLGRYDEALRVFPDIQVDARASVNTNCLLSLKLAVGEHISGKDALTLHGAQLTKFGRQHLDQASEYLDILLAAYERENDVNLLLEWASTSSSHNYGVFRGSSYGYYATQSITLPCYSFSLNLNTERFVKSITRDAENTIREEMGFPRVGEGWMSETELYYAVKKALPELEVIHHGSPEWLGKQHLDVYIPELRMALEYQGLQHDQPVAFFGGDEAFAKSQARDAKKKRLCDKHDVELVCVRPGYVLEDVVVRIRNRRTELQQSQTTI